MQDVFERLYRQLSRGPLPTVLVWLLVVVICATFASTGFGFGSIWNRVENRLVSIPGSESYRASEILKTNESASYEVYMIVTGVDMDKQRAEVLNVLNAATKNLLDIPGVLPAGVVHPFAAGVKPKDPDANNLMTHFIAKDRRGFLMVTLLDLTQFPERQKEIRKMVETEMQQVATDMRSFAPQVHGWVSDRDLRRQAVAQTARLDTSLASFIALVLVFLVLYFAFASLTLTLLAFGATLSGWALSRALMNLASLFAPPNPEDVSLVTMLSVGIVTGYAILLTARARSHLAIIKYTSSIPQIGGPRAPQKRSRRKASGSPLDEVFVHSVPPMLVSTTLITLGLVAVAVFPATNLRWVALVSILSIWGCFAIGLTLVPSLLYLGLRPLRRARPTWHRRLFGSLAAFFSRIWHTVTGWVLGRVKSPRGLGVALVSFCLIALALPTLGITWRTSGEDALPLDSPIARFQELRATQYGNTGAKPDVSVLAQTTSPTLAKWAGKVSVIPGVNEATVRPEAKGNYAVLDVTLKPELNNRSMIRVVEQIRSTPSGFTKLVTGQVANQIDFAKQLFVMVPLLGTIMMLATFLVLVKATRRASLALGSSVLNAVILLASTGLTALVFQDGLGSFLPFLSRSGGVEPSVAVLLTGFGFALALDYQVYAMSKNPQLAALEESAASSAGTHQTPRTGAKFALPDLSFLAELTQTRGTLWTKSLVNLSIFLAFLPVTSDAVKQPAFALAVSMGLNSILSRFLLSALMKPYPDQLPEDQGLIWLDETQN